MENAVVKTVKRRYSPSLCVTHQCNLSCVYCYQRHDNNSHMSFEVAKKIVDTIFNSLPTLGKDAIVLNFIGGEPLLEFELIKKIYYYVENIKDKIDVMYFATTNGTLLDAEMKSWFATHRDKFILGLSLDGTKETQDYNRSQSFDKIDIQFFLRTWPNQGVKMTISEFSLSHLAENIIYIHERGFKKIDGVNLYEGNFYWGKEEFIKILAGQLKQLVKYYVDKPELELNQMLNRSIELCSIGKTEIKKNCGVGENGAFFDTDGKLYPCSFMTPMTFSSLVLKEVENIDFTDANIFVDKECLEQCYIYPICPNCAAANYLREKKFNIRDKQKCRINRLIALFIADLHAKRITKYSEKYIDRPETYYVIEAIKKIRYLYLDEFKEYIEMDLS